MQDTKIFVDIDDEITFICERIFNSPSDRVILVVPERSTITTSLISLKMLKKQIQKHSQQIAIVTLDETGRRLAKQAGFVTRSRVGEVDEEAWEEAESIAAKDIRENNVMLMRSPSQGDLLPAPPFEEAPAPSVIPISNGEDKVMEENANEENTLQEEASEPEEEMAKANEVNISLDNNVEEKDFQREFISEEPTRFVPSSKKVSLDGFDMVVGGDIAIERAGENIDESKDFKETKNVVREFAKASSLINKDISGYKFQSEEKGNKKSVFSNAPKISLPKLGGSKVKKIGIAVLLLFLLVGTFFTYYLIPTAAITIYTQSNRINTNKTITASPNSADISIKTSQIPAQFFEVTETATDSSPTTGSTTIGNKAAGSIVIVNQTTQAYTLPAGTVFTTKGGNSYNYVLSSDVNVPAGNQDGPNAVIPANASAVLQGSDIGSQYNLPQNPPVTFCIKDQVCPLVSAYNTTAFTGGSSKTVQAVSQTDMNNLLSKLENELNQKGQSDLQSKVGSGEILLASSVKNIDVQKSFDNQLNAEASMLNLTLTTKTSGLGFKQSDLQSYAKKIVQSSANGYTLKSANANVIGSPSLDASGDISINTNITGMVVPNIDEGAIRSNIKGKSASYTEEYIKGLKGVKNVDVSINPGWLHSFLKHIPFQVNKINIDIKG